MKINKDNYKQFSYFILILIAISTSVVYCISYILKIKNINLPFWVEIPSISGVYALLFYLFDNFCWKWDFFKKIHLIIAEDLNGEWEGVAKSSYDKFKSNIKIVLKIKQKATNIIVNGIFDNSKSVSFNENFENSEIDADVALFYFFRNQPNYNAPETMAMHEGCVKLVYNKKDKSLEGYYYSGRDRNNHGTIKVFKKK
ncbi:MAG: hypothetical protein NT155_04175 [Candidatus Staskawiczbacteria bacterium]|nr:hypothetical protein [Candidatus Staskawiczbacteria bacterium]